ncbi:hypothetical protein [Planctomicrobium sp. SH527]|uniref:hypothetical protein n=1 Tax=Planctomicrobium sp. SH527 TaxID=3448123 RepID=UPI003F5B6272
MRESSPVKRFSSEVAWFGVILLIAFGLRAAVFHRYWADLDADIDVYLAIAQGLAEGRGYSSPGTMSPTAFRPPLYPLLLTCVSGADQQWGRAILQMGLSLATLWFVWLSARQLGLPRSGRLLAVSLIAIDPLLLRYVPYPMTETACGLLIAMLLWRLTLPKSDSLISPFLTGLVFGLCVLSRPTFWAFGLLFGAVRAAEWLIRRFLSRANSASSLDRSVKMGAGWKILAASLGIAVCVLPWGIRNWIQLGSPILMTTHGGYTLLLGNNEAFYREVVLQPFGTIWDGSNGPGQAAWVDALSQQMVDEGVTSEPDRDRWQNRLAWQTIFSHPLTSLRACFLKFCWFWNIAPHASAAQAIPASVRFAVGGYYSILWICLILGILRVLQGIFSRSYWGDRTSKVSDSPPEMDTSCNMVEDGCSGASVATLQLWLAPLLLVFAMTTAHLLYWSDARMRAPIMPAIVLLIAAAFFLRPKTLQTR